MPALFVEMANAGREAQVLPFQQKMNVCCINGITPAQLNAGFNLIAPGHGRTLRVLSFRVVVQAATIAAVTDIRLSSTEATPTDIATFAQAGLTSGARLGSGSTSGVVFGAGFPFKLANGQGVQLRKTGSTATGAFTVDVLLEYDIG